MRNRKQLKRIKNFAADHWHFKVDLMLDDFKKLEERVQELETRIEHHSDMIYNKLEKKKD